MRVDIVSRIDEFGFYLLESRQAGDRENSAEGPGLWNQFETSPANQAYPVLDTPVCREQQAGIQADDAR